MASPRLSPAASLLRNSRLFSLPPPLTPPAFLVSDSATQPHPTHAAIETPPISWKRGDWGFKRPLPLKSTARTGTTTIRVQNGIDSIEHITDFESAGDHVLTLQKWREINLPIRFIKKSQGDESTSVFHPALDNVDPPALSTHRKWRYQGPWLAGQTGWEFDTLLKRVKERQTEFHHFVRTRLNAERSASRRQEARDDGIDLEPGTSTAVTDGEFDEHMRYLRATPSAFGPLIAEFFDLPEGPRSTASTASSVEDYTYGRTTIAAEAYREIGPPKTHPSAGISYLQSGAHVHNHPVFGPQQTNPPVIARVLRPNIRRKPADLGMAGFVLDGNISSQLLGTQEEPVSCRTKMAVRPTMAVVDSGGRVILSAEKAQLDSARAYGLAPEPYDARERKLSKMANTRMMPQLDEKPPNKSYKEVDPFFEALEQTMRSNEERDMI